MKFKQESGCILAPDKRILHLVDGHPGYVDFPAGVILSLHKQSPGIVYALSHVHPNGMTGLSSTDEGTMRAWARAIYPFPIRMITITSYNYEFIETCYLGILESKESWINRKKETPRKFEIIKESETDEFPDNWYGWVLGKRSYE